MKNKGNGCRVEPAAQSQLPHLPPFSLAQVPAAQSQLPHFPLSLAIVLSSRQVSEAANRQKL